MSTHEHLSAASADRKTRLAQLKSLKRKQAPSDESVDTTTTDPTTTTTTLTTTEEQPSVTTTHLSGRNFDPTTRNVRLGFDNTPISDPSQTLEYKAQQLALASKTAQQEAEKSEELDLFKLQPKRANWDLKRDLELKMREGGLVRGFERAVGGLVRERVGRGKGQQEVGEKGGEGEGEGVDVGMEGEELVEATLQREREEEREREREREEEGDVDVERSAG